MNQEITKKYHRLAEEVKDSYSSRVVVEGDSTSTHDGRFTYRQFRLAAKFVSDQDRDEWAHRLKEEFIKLIEPYISKAIGVIVRRHPEFEVEMNPNRISLTARYAFVDKEFREVPYQGEPHLVMSIA